MIAAAALATLIAAIYVAAATRVRWRADRTACFVVGMVALAAAPAIGDRSLAAHMAEHSASVAVAAPLIVLGAPLTLALRTLPETGSAALLALLRRPMMRVLTHPAFAWPLFVSVQWVVHLTPLIDVGQGRPLLHAVEHAALFWTAILFWLPVIGRNPIPRPLRGWERSVYLFAAAPALDLVGALLISGGHQAAGVAMLAGMLPVALTAVAVTWEWLVREERRAARLEAWHAAG
jgi:putative membrane protein